MFFSKVFWMCVSSCKYWVIEVDAGLKIQCLSSSKRTFARFFLKHPEDLEHPREKDRLQSPLLVLIFGFLGICFDLISFWGTLALQIPDVMKQWL